MSKKFQQCIGDIEATRTKRIKLATRHPVDGANGVPMESQGPLLTNSHCLKICDKYKFDSRALKVGASPVYATKHYY